MDILFFILILFLYLYNIPFIILFLFNDYIRDKDRDYIIIDMIFIFIMCFWVGLWDQGFIGSLFVFIRVYDSMLFPFMFVVFGFCDNIKDSMFFYFSYIISMMIM